MIQLHPPFVPFSEETAVTVGFFDGLHRGHLHLLDRLRLRADAMGLKSCVVTFSEHPRKVVHTDYQPQLLTSLDEKIDRIDRAGIDYCMVLDFDKQLASLTAAEFMREVLIASLRSRFLLMGHDHRFGSDGETDFEHYRSVGVRLGICVERADALVEDGMTLSSSLVRRTLLANEISLANHYLGYPYTLSGTVVAGQQLGRRIGFPTANLQLTVFDKLCPPVGVYVVRCGIGAESYAGMMNIGFRPTIETPAGLSIEVHLFDFQANLYGATLHVELLHFLRQECRFDSIDALIEQLRLDRSAALYLLSQMG